MKESKKLRKDITQEELETLDENIRLQDQKRMHELYEKLNSEDINFDNYTNQINKQLSFNLLFDDVINEEE